MPVEDVCKAPKTKRPQYSPIPMTLKSEVSKGTQTADGDGDDDDGQGIRSGPGCAVMTAYYL